MSEPNKLANIDYDVPTAISTTVTTHAGQLEGSSKWRLSVSLSALDTMEANALEDKDSTQKERSNTPLGNSEIDTSSKKSSTMSASTSQEVSETNSSRCLDKDGEQSDPNSSKEPESEEEGDGYMDMSGGSDSPEPLYDVVRGENYLEGTKDQSEPDIIEEKKATPPDRVRPACPMKQPLPDIHIMEPPKVHGLDSKARPEDDPDKSGLDNNARVHEVYDTISHSQNTHAHNRLLRGVVIAIGIVACLALCLAVGDSAASWMKVTSDQAENEKLMSRIEALESRMNNTKPHPLSDEDWINIQGMIRQQVQEQLAEYDSRLNRLETSLTSTLNDTIDNLTKLNEQQSTDRETLDEQEQTLTQLKLDVEDFMNETQMHVLNFTAQFEETRRGVEILEGGQVQLQERVNQSRLDITREFSYIRTELSETTETLRGQFNRLNERTESFEIESREDIMSLYQSLNITTRDLFTLRSEFTTHESVFNQEVIDTKENITVLSTRVDANHVTIQIQLENATLQLREDLTTELGDVEKQFNSRLLNLTSETRNTLEEVHETLNKTRVHFDGRLDEQASELIHLRDDFRALLENVTLQVRDNFTHLTNDLRDTEMNFKSSLRNLTFETGNKFDQVFGKLNDTSVYFDGRLNEQAYKLNSLREESRALLENVTLQVQDNFTDLTNDLRATENQLRRQLHNVTIESRSNFETVREKLNETRAHFNGRLNEQTMRIGQLEINLSETNGNLDTANQQIGQQESRLTETSRDLESATQRIGQLETRLTETAGDLGTANQKIDQLKTRLTDTSGDLGTANQKIGQLEAGQQTITTDLGIAQNDIRNLREKQSSNGQTLTEHRGRLTVLESDVRDLKSSGEIVRASYTTIFILCLITIYTVCVGVL